MRDEAGRRASWPTDILIALIFGAVFYFLQEALQSLIVSPESSTARCENVLYDVAQPIIAGCAGLACWLYKRHLKAQQSQLKRIAWAYTWSWLALLGFAVRMAVYVLQFSPCSALYSPGPVRYMLGVEAYLIGGAILVIESSAWAIPCALFLWGYASIVSSPEYRP